MVSFDLEKNTTTAAAVAAVEEDLSGSAFDAR